MSDDLSGFSMIELFRSEVEGQAALLSAGLLALETADVDPATLEALMRAAHSIKGAARIVGLDAAVRIAHALEDCFVSAQRGQIRILPGHVDVLLRGVDLLSKVSLAPEAESEAWQAEIGPDIDAIVADLAVIQAGGMPAAPPLPSPAGALARLRHSGRGCDRDPGVRRASGRARPRRILSTRPRRTPRRLASRPIESSGWRPIA